MGTVVHDNCASITAIIESDFVAAELALRQNKCSWHLGKKLAKKLIAVKDAYITELRKSDKSGSPELADQLEAAKKARAALNEVANPPRGAKAEADRAIKSLREKMKASAQPLDNLIAEIENQISDKAKKLSDHFHRAATSCDRTLESFRSHLLNCIKHWAIASDHSQCHPEAKCKAPGWQRDTVPIGEHAAEIIRVLSPLLFSPKSTLNLFLADSHIRCSSTGYDRQGDALLHLRRGHLAH
jgi:hypothetical protein